MAKVCLIDGSGYIFRAFYALPNMTAPDGTPVNAVYGFVTMFMRLLKNIPCDYCVVLFDAKRENFRNEIYQEYKANRPELPELLRPQFELIHQAVEAMNLPYVLQEGYEADDLIATYAKQALEAGHEAVVVTADKDLMQLIRPGVQYYDGLKDKFFSDRDVLEKFGVLPDRVVDVQALSGDKTDNIPGVPGIGLKTAAELVNEYGSLEKIFDHIEEMKQNKRREMLQNYKDDAFMSLKLVTLNDHVPVLHQLEEFKCQAPNKNHLIGFIDRLGFQSIRIKLEKWIDERCADYGVCEPSGKEEKTVVTNSAPDHITVNSLDELRNVYRHMVESGKMAFEVLYDGVKICGLSVADSPAGSFHIPLTETNDSGDLFAVSQEKTGITRAELNKFITSVANNKNILKIASDIKSQWHLLNTFCQQRLDLFPYDDTAIMSYVLDSSEHDHDLATLCDLMLDEQIHTPKADPKSKLIDYSTDDNHKYIEDAPLNLMKIHRLLKQRLFNEHKDFIYEKLDRRLAAVLMDMEENGILVKADCLQTLDAEFAKQITELEKEIFNLAGQEFNLGSPKQVGEVLYQKLGLKGRRKSTGNYNTSAKALEKLAEENEIVAKILEWRSYAKLKSTYTTALAEARDKNGRVHTTFAQTVVNTGRLASSNPNLQNIPNRTKIGQKIRECFIAKPGYKLVAADYSQMELRLLASVADVKALKEAFAQGIDIHAATAARVFDIPYEQVDAQHRMRAKAINFGIVYGISQYGLSRQLNIPRAQAQKYIDSYMQIMPEIKQYMERTIEFARQHGYVTTPMGRKCSVVGINDKNFMTVGFAERAAINAPIQGGAADIVKSAMQKVAAVLKNNQWDAEILLQVHDELVLEVKQEQAGEVATALKTIMESAAQTDIPMVVDVGIGDNWHEAH